MRDWVGDTREHVKSAFLANPHYSFNDWTVMYDHSVRVYNIALDIAAHVKCDTLLLCIGALLHDIGKTYKADPEVLHKDHEKFNLEVSREFLTGLKLPADRFARLEDIVSHKGESVELKIIHDADALAMYADKRLYMLFIEWASKNDLNGAIKRKQDKFSHLNFPISAEIGRNWYEQMRKDWEAYLKPPQETPAV